MKIRRRIEMTIETKKFLTFRGGRQKDCEFCETCDSKAPLLKAPEAAKLAATNSRTIFRLIGAGHLHFRETAPGLLLVYSDSISAEKETQLSIKEKKNMKKVMTTLLLTIISAGFAFAQTAADEQELIKLDKEWSAAMNRGDRDALDRIVADAFTTRNGNFNKTQYIEQALKDKADDDLNLKNASAEQLNYSVKFKGAEIAVMTHFTIGKGAYKGKSFTNYNRSFHVWMKRGGRWQVVATESSPVPDGQVLRQIEREWGAAVKSKDKAWFERSLADEYTAIGSSGKMRNKTEDIAEMMSNTETVTTGELSQMRVHVNGDTATVIGRLHLVGKDKDGSFDRNYIFTDTFVRRDGRWQVISSQSTLVVPETTAKK